MKVEKGSGNVFVDLGLCEEPISPKTGYSPNELKSTALENWNRINQAFGDKKEENDFCDVFVKPTKCIDFIQDELVKEFGSIIASYILLA